MPPHTIHPSPPGTSHHQPDGQQHARVAIASPILRSSGSRVIAPPPRSTTRSCHPRAGHRGYNDGWLPARPQKKKKVATDACSLPSTARSALTTTPQLCPYHRRGPGVAATKPRVGPESKQLPSNGPSPVEVSRQQRESPGAVNASGAPTTRWTRAFARDSGNAKRTVTPAVHTEGGQSVSGLKTRSSPNSGFVTDRAPTTQVSPVYNQLHLIMTAAAAPAVSRVRS